METPLLKGAHKISQAQGCKTEAEFERSLGQTYLLILESLLERQVTTAAHPGDVDTKSSGFGELFLQ